MILYLNMDTAPKEQKTIESPDQQAESVGLPIEQERIAETAPSSATPAEKQIIVDRTLTPSLPTSAPITAPTKSQLEKEIEDVLAEDLEELYWALPEPERMIFKHKGEETASRIRILLGEAAVRFQEIFNLIVEWLKLLPGVSKFFIEQEAKIKTDKLIKFR